MDSFFDSLVQMIDRQIKARGVTDDAVLSAMLKIRRHFFIPETDQPHSYEDRPLVIGYGQTISQPYIVAYMSELLELRPSDRVLEIGTGSGYQTAILAEITAEVFSIERIQQLSDSARTRLCDQLGYRNIRFKVGDGRQGWPEYQPFDKIILTAAPTDVPPVLFHQLSDQGILLAPVGDSQQYIIKFRKEGGSLKRETLLPVSFVPML